MQTGLIAFNDEYRDYQGHGTAIAGILRSKAPDVELYSVKVFAERLRTDSRVLAAAIRSCIANDIRVINLSLGTVRTLRVIHCGMLARLLLRETSFLSLPVQRANASFLQVSLA